MLIIALGCILIRHCPEWLNFWWVLLLPIVFTKVFLKKSKFAEWLEKEI